MQQQEINHSRKYSRLSFFSLDVLGTPEADYSCQRALRLLYAKDIGGKPLRGS